MNRHKWHHCEIIASRYKSSIIDITPLKALIFLFNLFELLLYMNTTKYICANILSLFGNFGLLVLLSYMFLAILVYPDYLVDGYIFTLVVLYSKTSIYIIPSLLILIPIENILARKLVNKESFLNIQIKNKYLRLTYNVLFWLGITFSLSYLFVFIYFY